MEKHSQNEKDVKDLFIILPLDWKKSFEDWCQRWEARVPMGSYWVQRRRENCDPKEAWEGWRWGFLFDEYYDEHSEECESVEEGKRLAWEEWQSRIFPALRKVES